MPRKIKIMRWFNTYSLLFKKKKRFKTILRYYPVPGHSFLLCDRSFDVVEKHVRKVERVYTPNEYMNLYEKSSKYFSVINVNQNMIFNYVDYLKPLFKKTVVNSDRLKFTVSKYKLLLYEDDKDYIQCSESTNTNKLYNFTRISI